MPVPTTPPPQCVSPPLHLDASTEPRWNSETDLLAGLARHYREEEEEADGGGGQTLGGYPNAREKSLGGVGESDPGGARVSIVVLRRGH